MSRSIFGWSYPPGAVNDPFAPWNIEDGPCRVCGQSVDDCICPECPECGEVGNPTCYGGTLPHLKITREQIEMYLRAREEEGKAAEAEDKYYGEQYEQWKAEQGPEVQDRAIDEQLATFNLPGMVSGIERSK